LIKHTGPRDANVAWAGANICRSLKELSSEFSLLWTGSLDEIFRSSQQRSTPVGAENSALSFAGLLDLTQSLSDLKALRGGKIICILKPDTVCILSRAVFTSDLNSVIKLSLPCG